MITPMMHLSKLPQDIQDIVVSLPYRVGLYISESDQTGGDDSSLAERRALENIVTFYVEDTVKSEFAHEVMLETLNRKSQWEGWAQDIGNVPEECMELAYMLKEHVDTKEVAAYKQNLLEVGIAVAQAYCEFSDNVGRMARIETYIALFLKRVQGIFGGEQIPSNDYVLNISAAEKAAIMRLARNLDVKVTF